MKLQTQKKRMGTIAYVSLALIQLSALGVHAQHTRITGKTNMAYQDNYQRINAGSDHLIELKNGKIYGTGGNEFGQIGSGANQISTFTQIGSSENWAIVSAGKKFTLAISADGKLWSWGQNDKGQLGTGDQADKNTPTQIGTDKWLSISAGNNSAIGIKSDGTLWTWGDNTLNKLGIDGFTDAVGTSPQQIGTENNWYKVSAGGEHSLALKANGTIWVWGINTSGQLGLGNNQAVITPTQIALSLGRWKYISAGENFSTAILDNGTLWAWGENANGQLANGSTASTNAPTQVEGDRWRQVEAGKNHVVGLKSNGTVWTWGDEIGENSLTPGQITQKEQIRGAVQVSAGTNFTAVVDSKGYLFTWGKNTSGQLGLTTTENYNEPTNTNRYSNEIVSTTASHGFNTFTLSSKGEILGWGRNDDHLVGSGYPERVSTPHYVTAAGDKNIAVESGFAHVLTIRNDGSLWTWGESDNTAAAQQIGTDKDWAVIAAGFHTSAAIKIDGSLWMWGSNTSGELGSGDLTRKIIPTRVGTDNNWSSITMGSSHTIAIKSDGTLWGWGRNYVGESGNGEDISNVLTPTQIGTEADWVYISAASYSTLAIKADGTLWAWGSASMGQLGINLPLPIKVLVPTLITNDVVSARLGNWSGSAIKNDGSVLAWGNLNSVFGELGMGDNNNYPTPTLIPNQENVIHISAGQAHKNILKAQRESLCVVGRNFDTELGLGYESINSINTYECGVSLLDPTEEPNYCQTIISNNVEPITSVKFGEINNQTSNTLNGTPAYEDFTNIVSVVEKDYTYTLYVEGNTDEKGNQKIRVYIDWNQDMEFNTTDEFYEMSLDPSNGIDGVQAITEIQIPVTAQLGNTRMRIVKGEWATGVNLDVCSSFNNGQVEDYTLNVTSPQPIIIESVEITTIANLPAQINTISGTLQLIAKVNPIAANQSVIWTITSGQNVLTVSPQGLLTALANGTAVIRATSVEDQTIYGEIEIKVITSGLSIETLQANTKLYPNPVNDVLNIELPNTYAEITVKVMDQTGRIVIDQQNSDSQTVQINSMHLAKGLYQVIISIEDEYIVQKFIKN